MVSSDYLLQRIAFLRRSELSKWARMIKPVTKTSFGFSAGWFTPPDGPPRRLITAVEARKGAAQEWSKLMIEPPCEWHHPLITQYKDEFGRPRGTINLEVACNAPPGDITRDIAVAYMGSSESGYSIMYWSSPCEVQWLSEYSVQIKDCVISKESGLWKLILPSLRHGASGEVVAICGERPENWDRGRWNRRVEKCPHGGFVFVFRMD